MQAVGQGEIDNTELAAEGYSRFCPLIGQRSEAGAMAACEYDAKCFIQYIFDHLAYPILRFSGSFNNRFINRLRSDSNCTLNMLIIWGQTTINLQLLYLIVACPLLFYENQ